MCNRTSSIAARAYTPVPENLLENRSRVTNPAGIHARALAIVPRLESWESNRRSWPGMTEVKMYGALTRHNSFAARQTRPFLSPATISLERIPRKCAEHEIEFSGADLKRF